MYRSFILEMLAWLTKKMHMQSVLHAELASHCRAVCRTAEENNAYRRRPVHLVLGSPPTPKKAWVREYVESTREKADAAFLAGLSA